MPISKAKSATGLVCAPPAPGRAFNKGSDVMWKVIAPIVCAALFVAGCQTQDPYTGEDKTSHATRGAVIGGIAGAGIGALTNRHQAGRNALIGAGIGALAGAAIGNYMDDEEAELRHRLRAAGVSVTRKGDRII